jgi:orotidine-5'-phosphate decarboxylase
LEPRIIVALDYSRVEDACRLAADLNPSHCVLKVGKEMFARCGPALVERFVEDGFRVFLDLKYHDIPNTVAGACRAAAEVGVWMLNVHALGGRKMMQAARQALVTFPQPPLLVAVTVLTSLAEKDIEEIGLQGTAGENVARLARLAEDSGLDGVVCSPLEIEQVRACSGDDFIVVTAGVRPPGSAQDDQSRTMSPAEAIRRGADYLVIGRPITRSADPLRTLLTIESELIRIVGR